MARTSRARTLIWVVLGLIALGLAVFFVAGPGLAERGMNQTGRAARWTVTQPARALHQELTIADLHVDTLLWKRDITQFSKRGHVDVPRLEAGNVALVVLSSVTKTPRGQNFESNTGETDNITLLAIGQLQPPSTWTSLLERSLWHAEKLRRAEGTPDGLRIVRTARDLDELLAARAQGRNRIGALLSIEGMHNLEGEFANLDRLYRAGYRMGGLVHFFDNELGGSMHGVEKGGLTPFGRRVIRAMEDRGMLVDVAHASPQTLAETVAIARRPLIYSHGGVKGTCDNNRTLTDAEVRGIASTGGLIGIGLWDGAVCGDKPAHTARAMAYVRDLVGIEHVALGSDFDGAVTTPIDAAGLPALTQALIDEGFSPQEIHAAMGGNVIRVLRQTLPPR